MLPLFSHENLSQSSARWSIKPKNQHCWMPCTPQLCACLERLSLIDTAVKPKFHSRCSYFEMANTSFFVSPIHIVNLPSDKGTATIQLHKQQKVNIRAHRPPPLSMIDLMAPCSYGLSIYPPSRAVVEPVQWLKMIFCAFNLHSTGTRFLDMPDLVIVQILKKLYDVCRCECHFGEVQFAYKISTHV